MVPRNRPNADKTKVNERYRKLMQLNHPDAGGSPLLASKINEAKDLLLGEKRMKRDAPMKNNCLANVHKLPTHDIRRTASLAKAVCVCVSVSRMPMRLQPFDS
jgi:hypothetical protein